ncbi:hypothetical protein K458DRAFT_84355 [Lentithecium fluviatile CBS 122367]|uniref:Uncharacterized protein n=1 Tax=Lentithecium fluviatile CBS 122367 TaxID=1168545 RepID=A0A6G1IRS5_9PLEO|nr:hypothetical protein K458DRAFT_84355 [Lentithecium fluviatile CBS 122367]
MRLPPICPLVPHPSPSVPQSVPGSSLARSLPNPILLAPAPPLAHNDNEALYQAFAPVAVPCAAGVGRCQEALAFACRCVRWWSSFLLACALWRGFGRVGGQGEGSTWERPVVQVKVVVRRVSTYFGGDVLEWDFFDV